MPLPLAGYGGGDIIEGYQLRGMEAVEYGRLVLGVGHDWLAALAFWLGAPVVGDISELCWARKIKTSKL